MTETPYAIAIFVSRESTERAMQTIAGALASSLPGTAVDVLINGNPALARSLPGLCNDISVPKGKRLRLWRIALGDKANAWNQFVHCVFGGQEIVWFMDGYVTPNQDAFASMQSGLVQNASVLAATAVPTTGISAAGLRRRMRTTGGLQGNFFCVRGTLIERIAEQGIRLPLGLYWVDGLVGALLNFNLDPSRYRWDPQRVWVDHAATWERDAPGLLSPGGLRNRLRRLARQTRGRIENRAFREFLHVKRRNPKNFPPTVNDLVSDWIRASPVQAMLSVGLRPWRWHAYRQLKGRHDWSSHGARAELVIERLGA